MTALQAGFSSRRETNPPDKWRLCTLAGRTHLSVSQSGSTPRMDYVPCEYQQQVLEYVENYRQARDILKAVCAINRELLRRRQRL